MSEARLQQVGSPQELYDHPQNRFVAGFIGSPSMNFLEVDVTRSGDTAQLKGDGIDIPLPDRYHAGFQAFSGNKLIVGVRPEHLDVKAEGPSGTLQGNADVVEYLGNEELIHFTVGGHDIVAVIGSENHVQPGDDLTLHVPNEKVHLFDPESTLALDVERDESAIRKGGAARKEEEAPAAV
jgi:multiple sugar transport system ATP-binding protein